MAKRINVGGVHHLRLTVSDVQRARDFYTTVLGFDFLMDLPPGVCCTMVRFCLVSERHRMRAQIAAAIALMKTVSGSITSVSA